MKGYAGKLLFVNLEQNKIDIRPLKEEDARNFIGGPGLGAKILYEEMPAHADVFGPESMVGILGGPLNNTRALFGGRYTVVSKSPVTGGWNDANSGGYFAPMLKRAGFDGVFVNGIAKTPVYIFIDEGKAEIRDASALWGLTVSETEEKFKQMHGEKINAALIGPAGENLSGFAAVMNDGHRAAGRGGTGAVMGSKKLKAIVVKGALKTEIADDEALVSINKDVMAHLKGPMLEMFNGFGTYGTGITYMPSVLSGDTCIKNWSGAPEHDMSEEEAYKVSSLHLDQFRTEKYNCASCPLGCGAFLNVPSERWDMHHSSRPEYEAMGAYGPTLMNTDYEALVRANDLCNEYGLDVISAGSTVAWAMECYNEGVLSKEELDGIDLTWGNGDAIVELTEKMGKGEGVGRILLKGTAAAADHFGKGHEYLVVASGIEEPQHDSRLQPALARMYKYDPTPGRHVKGNMGMDRIGPGGTFEYESTGPREKGGVVGQEICNSSGFCLMGMMFGPAGSVFKMINAITGFDYTDEEIEKLGLRMYNMRNAFNLREGIRRGDYTLSKRMYEANPPHKGPLAGVVIDVERLADNLFNEIGWDENMVPKKEELERLGGLEAVIADLYQ